LLGLIDICDQRPQGYQSGTLSYNKYTCIDHRCYILYNYVVVNNKKLYTRLNQKLINLQMLATPRA